MSRHLAHLLNPYLKGMLGIDKKGKEISAYVSFLTQYFQGSITDKASTLQQVKKTIGGIFTCYAYYHVHDVHGFKLYVMCMEGTL